jgi:hypothetical protein
MPRIATAAVLSAATLLPLGFGANLPDPSESQIQDIIAKFAAKETQFAQARGNYTYRQTAKINILDDSGNPTSEHWQIVSDIIFSPEGKRTEKVVYAPVNTLQSLILTPEDEQDLRDVQPFVLTTAEVPEYYIRYLGHEPVDEITCYVFAIKPKKLEPGKRYFEGEIWVDDKDLQIVKTYGRGTGHLKKGPENLFPKFETYRQQIDGKYWFPVYTIANDTLNFKDTAPVKIKQVVKYEDYKQFKSDVNIKFGDEADTKTETPAKPPTPPKKP